MKSSFSDHSTNWLETAPTRPSTAPKQMAKLQMVKPPMVNPAGSSKNTPTSPEGDGRSKFMTILRALGICLATCWLVAYLIFRAYYINFYGWLAPFAVLLFVAELHSILHTFGMFYSLWPRKYESWPEPNRSRLLRCNLFVCVCGEPPEVVKQTIMAAQKAAQVFNETNDPIHPARVVVLNDGKVAVKDNWRDIEAICEQLGVMHIARSIPGGFKAGNINNGLMMTPTDDAFNTLDVVFDSDFCALPEFLTEITKPFVDETIDWVQTPQRYQNEKTWVAQASAAHQIFFFEHICPAKGYDNALFLCGTNFAIRRSALDLVGGIETKYITEDYATSLNLHQIGRRGVFIPKVLALGMAPSSLKQYFTQQRRWSKGSFDTTKGYMRELLFGPMTPKQKMHYMLSATYYLIGLRDLILMMAPVPYLFFGISLIRANSLWFLLCIYLPLIVPNFLLYLKLFRHPMKSLILDVVSFPVFTSAFFQSMFGQKLGFVVTIKKYERENPFSVYRTQLAVAVTLVIGLIYSCFHFPMRGLGMAINYWWAGFDASFLLLGFSLIVRENFNWGSWETETKEKIRVRRQLAQEKLGSPASAKRKPVLQKTVLAPEPAVLPQPTLPVTVAQIAASTMVAPTAVEVVSLTPKTVAAKPRIEKTVTGKALKDKADNPKPTLHRQPVEEKAEVSTGPSFVERFNRTRDNRSAVFGEYVPPRS